MKPVHFFPFTVAWMNFISVLAGVLKFIPLAYVSSQSVKSTTSTVALRWSLDLVSDTHWIVLAWVFVLVLLRYWTGYLMLQPWRFTVRQSGE